MGMGVEKASWALEGGSPLPCLTIPLTSQINPIISLVRLFFPVPTTEWLVKKFPSVENETILLASR